MKFNVYYNDGAFYGFIDFGNMSKDEIEKSIAEEIERNNKNPNPMYHITRKNFIAINESKYEEAGRKAFWGLEGENILKQAGLLPGGCTLKDAIDYFVEHGEELEALGLIFTKFSLIQVYEEKDGLINGVWLQDHTGTLKTAIETAKKTEQANSNKITVAVVDKVNGSSPNYSLLTNLKRLD
jgi:hypothetical protein